MGDSPCGLVRNGEPLGGMVSVSSLGKAPYRLVVRVWMHKKRPEWLAPASVAPLGAASFAGTLGNPVKHLGFQVPATTPNLIHSCSLSFLADLQV